MTVTRFDSLDAVREFAGEEYELAVISDEAAPAPLVIRRARSDWIGAAAVVLDDSRRVLLSFVTPTDDSTGNYSASA
jgi:hypothetical protein